MRIKREMKFQKIAMVVTTVTVSLSAFFALPAMADPVPPLLLPGIGTVGVTDVAQETFDLPDAWEVYSSPRGVELAVENGVYRTYAANPGYVWGLNEELHTNVVAEVEVTPLTIFTDIGAGVMCRADTSNNGDGYYFMINASGYYSILVGQGTGIYPLIDWQPSTAVRTGIDRNTVGAVCLGNQLAMYVNDELVATVVDDTYTSGFTGLTVAAGNNGVDVAFDNLTLYTLDSNSMVADLSTGTAG